MTSQDLIGQLTELVQADEEKRITVLPIVCASISKADSDLVIGVYTTLDAIELSSDSFPEKLLTHLKRATVNRMKALMMNDVVWDGGRLGTAFSLAIGQNIYALDGELHDSISVSQDS